MLNSNFGVNKQNYFEKIAQNFMIFSIILVVIMSGISTVVLVARAQNSFQLLEEGEILDGSNFFLYLVLYGPLLPIAIYGTLDLILLFQRRNLQSAFSVKMTQDPETEIKVLNPNTMPNLGQVSYCFLDKTGTLSTGNFKIKSIITNWKNYKIDSDVIQAKLAPPKTKYSVASPISPHKRSFHKEFFQQDPGRETNTHTPQKNVSGHQHSTFQKDKDDNDKLLNIGEPELRRSGSDDFSMEVEIVVNNEGEHFSLTCPNKPSYKTKDETDLRNKNKGRLQQINEYILIEPNAEIGSLKGEVDATSLVLPDIKLNTLLQVDQKDKIPVNSLNQTSEAHIAGTISHLKNEVEILQRDADTNEFLHDFLTGDSEAQLHELAKCLSLCHACRTKYQADGYVYEAVTPEDAAILKFARSLGYDFEMSNRPDNPSIYTVRENGTKKNYNVLGVNEFSYGRRRLSVCIREPSAKFDAPATLFVRGSDVSMRERLVLDEQELDIFNKIVAKNTMHGYRTIVFAKKELSGGEAMDFFKKYQNLKSSLYNQNQGLEQLACEYEGKLKLVGVIGLQDETTPFAAETLSTMREAGINCWMLTGDTYEQAMSTGYLLEFINEKRDIHFVNATQYDDTRAQIRSILNNIKKKIDETQGKTEVNIGRGRSSSATQFRKSVYGKTELGGKNKILLSAGVVVSGDAWQTIVRDNYLLSNFAFICAVSGTLIGYGLSPKNKQEIVEMVQKHFPDRPITLAVGDGLNDALMMQTADISIEIANKNDQSRHTTNAGDIRIQSLKVMEDILLIHGRNYMQKTEISIIHLFYKSYLLGFPIFFYSWYCSFTNTAVINSNLVFFFSFLFTFFPIIMFSASSPRDSSIVLRNFPALYMDGKLQKQRIFQLFIFRTVFESLIHACIIFYVVIYAIQDSVSEEGINASREMMSLEIFYGIISISNVLVII